VQDRGGPQHRCQGGFRQDTLRDAAHAAWSHRIWRAADLGPSTTLPPSTQHYLLTTVRTQWFYVLDLIGTAAFGLAGFMRAQRGCYNLWGAFVCTAVPAVGGGALLFLLLLQLAARYEHEPWLVTAAIVCTLLVTFTARIIVIKFRIRSYRLVARRKWKSQSPQAKTPSSWKAQWVGSRSSARQQNVGKGVKK
jgi:Predicted membrane protein